MASFFFDVIEGVDEVGTIYEATTYYVWQEKFPL